MDEALLRRLSPAGLYGDQAFFERCLADGFTEFVYGDSGAIVDEIRLVGVFACIHPKGKVSTIETLKSYADYATVRGQRKCTYRSFRNFEEEMKKYDVHLTDKMSLSELVERGRAHGMGKEEESK